MAQVQAGPCGEPEIWPLKPGDAGGGSSPAKRGNGAPMEHIICGFLGWDPRPCKRVLDVLRHGSICAPRLGRPSACATRSTLLCASCAGCRLAARTWCCAWPN